jgi:hypothetical protein
MIRQVNNVNFVVNPIFTYGKTGWSPYDSFLSGTEDSIREWSRIMVEQGMDVTVYYNGEPTEYMGVKYRDYPDYEPAPIEINIKYSEFKHHPESTAWYLTNEFNVAQKNLKDFEGVIFPSKWAVDNLGYNGRFKVVPHGFDKDRVHVSPKIRKQCLYASSPDRGLDELLDMWPDIYKAHPDATLIVTYSPEGRRSLPGVMYFGQVDDHTMNELFNTSDVWPYPCNGGELYCMVGIKAQVAGCVPIFYPTQALAETVRVGVRTDRHNFIPDMIDLLDNEHKKSWIREHLASEYYPDWYESTRILLNAIGVYCE